MGKANKVGLLLLVVVGGCRALTSSNARPSAPADPLQEAILKAKDLESRAGRCRKRPDAVLKEVPLGTPVDQAQTIMAGHGFGCHPHGDDGQGPALFCRAYQPTSWVSGTFIDVTLHHRDGRIRDVEVVTIPDGP